MDTQVCKKCSEEKTLDCFSKSKNTKSGYLYTCKKCVSKSNILRYKNNEAYRERCKEHMKKYMRCRNSRKNLENLENPENRENHEITYS